MDLQTAICMLAGKADRGMCPAPSNGYPLAVWRLARLLAFAAKAQGKSSSDNGQAAAQEFEGLKVKALRLA